MYTALVNRPGGIAAGGTWSESRRGWISAVVFVTLLAAAAGARLTGPLADMSPTPAASSPVAISQTWLVTHDYWMLAELRGARTRNVTVVRRGDAVRGDVQTMRAGEQTGYYSFRLHGGSVETSTAGSLGLAHWTAATPAQEALVSRVTDPRWMLAPFQSSAGLRDLGRSGDAELHMSRGGDSLYMLDGRPFQVVSQVEGTVTRTFRIEARPAAAVR